MRSDVARPEEDPQGSKRCPFLRIKTLTGSNVCRSPPSLPILSNNLPAQMIGMGAVHGAESDTVIVSSFFLACSLPTTQTCSPSVNAATKLCF